MPSIVLASAVLSLAIQAQGAPHLPPGAIRTPGIVEAPGGTRWPVAVVVRGRTGDSTFGRDLREARREIDRRRENGELTRREARQLRREVAMISTLAQRYGRDGLSDSERRELDMHAQTVRTRSAIR